VVCFFFFFCLSVSCMSICKASVEHLVHFKCRQKHLEILFHLQINH
jgi:hypothetical protein